MAQMLPPLGVVIHSPATAGGVVAAAAVVAAAGAAAAAVDSSTGLPVPIWSLCASIALIAPLPEASEAAGVGAAVGARAGAGAGATAGAAAGLSSARRGCAASADDAASTAHRTAREARMAATGWGRRRMCVRETAAEPAQLLHGMQQRRWSGGRAVVRPATALPRLDVQRPPRPLRPWFDED